MARMACALSPLPLTIKIGFVHKSCAFLIMVYDLYHTHQLNYNPKFGSCPRIWRQFASRFATVAGVVNPAAGVRKRITRVKLLGFLAAQTRCVVAMEACAGAHYWARKIAKLGHHVRLIAPTYVKPFIKR
jgi:hypothetical protein